MKYRFYSFMNFYLSSLQQGLQSGHLISELFVKYQSKSDNFKNENKILFDWAANDKVMIVCNGGNSKSIKELYNFFMNISSIANKLPHSIFFEDDDSLNNALTGCCIIIPEIYFDVVFNDDNCYYHKTSNQDVYRYNSNTEEYKFIEKIKSFSLAK